MKRPVLAEVEQCRVSTSGKGKKKLIKFLPIIKIFNSDFWIGKKKKIGFLAGIYFNLEIIFDNLFVILNDNVIDIDSDRRSLIIDIIIKYMEWFY